MALLIDDHFSHQEDKKKFLTERIQTGQMSLVECSKGVSLDQFCFFAI